MSEIDTLVVHPAVAGPEVPVSPAWGGDTKIMPSKAYSPIRLIVASLTSDHAVLLRRIGRGLAIRVPQAGNDAMLAVYMAPDAPAELSEPVIFSGSFGAIEVEQGARLIRGLSGIDLSREQIDRGEDYDWLHAAVLGRLHGTPFGIFDNISHAGEIAPNAVAMRIVLRTGDHAISVHAKGSASTWLDLLARIEWVREKQRHPLLPALPLPLPVTLARHTLPRSELRGLRPGDVILPSNSRFACNGNGIVSLGNVAMHVRYHAPSTLEIIKMEDKLDEQYMEDIDDDEAFTEDSELADSYDDVESYDNEADEPQYKQEQQNGDFAAVEHAGTDKTGKVPVTLDFSLGHVQLTLDDVDTLGPGSVLMIEGGSPTSIAIVVGGQVLGRGEAVDVNGQLGIRIVQWG